MGRAIGKPIRKRGGRMTGEGAEGEEGRQSER